MSLRVLVIGIVLSLFTTALASAQALAQAEVINNVRLALKSGSAKELSKHFNGQVEMEMEGEMAYYSRTQAEFVLRDFFRKYPPVTYSLSHQGESPDGSRYTIGKYAHRSGAFIVWMLIRKSEGEYRITTINFTEEN